MAGAHCREMPAIGGKDLRHVQSLRGGNYSGVDKSKSQIRVLPEESVNACDVLRLEGLDCELTCRNGMDECGLCLSRYARVQEVADFRKNRNWNDDGFTV